MHNQIQYVFNKNLFKFVQILHYGSTVGKSSFAIHFSTGGGVASGALYIFAVIRRLNLLDAEIYSIAKRFCASLVRTDIIWLGMLAR